jgi:two-component system, sensor histidine kinase and response regulator
VTSLGLMMNGTYDYRLVALSLAIAVMASYAALDLAGRVTSTRGQARYLWLGGGATAMGIGIWSMHYVGMLAFHLPVSVEYDWPTVLASLMAAIFASAVALFVVSRERMGFIAAMVGSVLMGSAIAGMHYTGMAAMRLSAMCHYSPALVSLSIVLAVAISLVALLLAFYFRGETISWSWQKGASALMMGAAIPVMHYTGMAAATLTPTALAHENFNHALSISSLGIAGIILVTFIVLGLTLLTSVADRRFSAQAMELEVSELRFRAVFEGAGIGIAITELANGKVLAINQAYQKMLGCTSEEMRSAELFDQLTHPDDRAKGQLEFERLRAGQQDQVHMENRYVRRDSSEVTASIDLSVLRDSHGKSQFALGLATDVTERNRAEAELQQAKESAEAASEAKSTFLATMSHEIRTPMNGILGMTELVLDTDLTVEQRESLGLVRLSAESLLSIINDILDFSKIEAGKLELESIPFDLRESLGETLRALSFRTDQKGLELIYEVQPDVPEALVGDPGRIRQILINLIGNSIKFTDHGEIFVNVEEQSQGLNTTFLHFAVKDTGVGIPEDKQVKIFEAFSQADGSMARKYGGTGLGLTICVRLVGMMGGRIWVESQPGSGSTFHFTVQLGVQDTPSSRAPVLQPDQLRDLHVLVVDDNFTNRRVLQGMLARWGMKPTAVDGGRAALQALEIAKSTGRPFPLILLDGQMPEMDGFTLADRIRKDPDMVGASIMMLTSAGHLGDAARCRELRISGYLVKPIRQSELQDSICQILQKSPKKSTEPLVTRHTLRETKSRSRVLLAEDNPVNRTLAVRLLEKRGYVVTVAGDGRAAVAAVEKESFDIVLMDVQMPEMDGFEATTAIRQREKSTGRHIPIIAMTAHALKGDEDHCLSAGMDGYVSKPIRTHELFAKIESVMAKYGDQNEGGEQPTDSRSSPTKSTITLEELKAKLQ